ncbi:MAG TPA: phosphoenolpyruvate carboxykinase (GTP) [Dehalococcoidia bacterium]|nr:phosphoenolpyruvate carboxykinase (GTP) [Dehalococcoidia bacterium]
MTNQIDSALDAAHLQNTAARDFVRQWAAHTQPDRIEVVSAADDDRLLREALAAGEVQEVAGNRYYSRSYSKDTARSEERTFVATSNPADKGAYNNWVLAAELKPKVEALMAGASRGKTMYVVPYLMSPPGSPLAAYAAGVELTDSRVVVLHMIRMARVGPEHVDSLADQSHFVRGVHVTGDLENLEQGTPNDKRYFVTVADERLILHFGSSYGGNALLGKIAHGLRQASFDGQASRRFLAEQFMLIGVLDRETGATSYICGGFPSASGKTNLAMMVPPASLAKRYDVHFLGDDIAWIYLDESDGKLYALNPEYGVFGVAKDTNEQSNPNAIAAIAPGTKTLFTNTAYNEAKKDVWWEGKTPRPPEDVSGWRDWRGDLISDRPLDRQRSGAAGDEWSHPNSRFTTTLANVPNLSPEANNPKGVPIDAIIFGGRVKDREPLIRAMRDVADGVYDGLTLGAEATFAAENTEGVMRYDPMSMRPFMSYSEGHYAQRWLEVIGAAGDRPVFAHVNWFQREADGRYIWPGYGDNLRALLWLLRFKTGSVHGRETPIGALPLESELPLEGIDLSPEALQKLLTVDVERWQREVASREALLAGWPNLPAAIWEAHRRLAAALQ